MAYTSKTLIERAISEQTVTDLCDDEKLGSGNSDIADRVSQAITDACREIDGYCQAHYEVPFDGSGPTIVQSIALTLAIFFLYRRRRSIYGMPDDVAKEYDRVQKQLLLINQGKLDLGLEPPPTKSSKVVATSDGPDQLFTSDTLEDF